MMTVQGVDTQAREEEVPEEVLVLPTYFDVEGSA